MSFGRRTLIVGAAVVGTVGVGSILNVFEFRGRMVGLLEIIPNSGEAATFGVQAGELLGHPDPVVIAQSLGVEARDGVWVVERESFLDLVKSRVSEDFTNDRVDVLSGWLFATTTIEIAYLLVNPPLV